MFKFIPVILAFSFSAFGETPPQICEDQMLSSIQELEERVTTACESKRRKCKRAKAELGHVKFLNQVLVGNEKALKSFTSHVKGLSLSRMSQQGHFVRSESGRCNLVLSPINIVTVADVEKAILSYGNSAQSCEELIVGFQKSRGPFFHKLFDIANYMAVKRLSSEGIKFCR